MFIFFVKIQSRYLSQIRLTNNNHGQKRSVKKTIIIKQLISTSSYYHNQQFRSCKVTLKATLNTKFYNTPYKVRSNRRNYTYTLLTPRKRLQNNQYNRIHNTQQYTHKMQPTIPLNNYK